MKRHGESQSVNVTDEVRCRLPKCLNYCFSVLANAASSYIVSECYASWCVTCTNLLTTQPEESVDWGKRTTTWRPNSWHCITLIDNIQRDRYSVPSSSGLLAHAHAMAIGDKDETPAIERRPRVQVPGRSSFSQVATFHKLCS